MMKTLFKIPLWFISVFSWDKSFRKNPIIGNYLLNRLGLHVFRVIVSHALFSFRLWLLTPLLSRADRQFFKENGFILKQDFLPPDEFKALKQELLTYDSPVREFIMGDSLVQSLFLNKTALSELPECQRFTQNQTLTKLMRYCSSKNSLPLFSVDKLKFHSFDSTYPDPQQTLHVDTFHPCVKGWLFMDDVDTHNGAHTFIPGSHRLTWRRLQWEYRQSLAQSRPINEDDSVDSTPRHYWDGSFRANADDLEFLNYQPPRVFCIPANTLLIDNVRGIHSRGNPQHQTTRMTVSMIARDNPFNPFVTPCPQLTARAFEWVWERMVNKGIQQRIKEGKIRFSTHGFQE